MREKDVPERAFAMRLRNATNPPGPYRLVNRANLIINCMRASCRLRATPPAASRLCTIICAADPQEAWSLT